MKTNLLNTKTESALNEAIHAELYAANLYLHLSVQCQRIGLFGAAKYFKSEAGSEREHYQILADYMNDRGATAEIPLIEAMTDKVENLFDAVAIAYEVEVELGQKYEMWYEDVDVTTKQRLLQFIETQRESVGEYGDLLARINLCKEEEGGFDGCAILIIDKEMGE